MVGAARADVCVAAAAAAGVSCDGLGSQAEAAWATTARSKAKRNNSFSHPETGRPSHRLSMGALGSTGAGLGGIPSEAASSGQRTPPRRGVSYSATSETAAAAEVRQRMTL